MVTLLFFRWLLSLKNIVFFLFLCFWTKTQVPKKLRFSRKNSGFREKDRVFLSFQLTLLKTPSRKFRYFSKKLRFMAFHKLPLGEKVAKKKKSLLLCFSRKLLRTGYLVSYRRYVLLFTSVRIMVHQTDLSIGGKVFFFYFAYSNLSFFK